MRCWLWKKRNFKSDIPLNTLQGRRNIKNIGGTNHRELNLVLYGQTYKPNILFIKNQTNTVHSALLSVFLWISLYMVGVICPSPWLELRIGLMYLAKKGRDQSPRPYLYVPVALHYTRLLFFLTEVFVWQQARKKSLHGWYCWST